MPIGIYNGNSRHMQYMRELEEEARKQKVCLALDLGDALNELRELDPRGWEKWYDENVPDGATYAEILPLVQARVAELNCINVREEFKALDILVEYVPPEPETAGEAHAAMLMDSGWPWTPEDDEDLRGLYTCGI